ncbi:MAG: type III-B CRISPR module-associated protein Cmr5 [Candidatus Edwardsbacteria bacterium]|nr:type III-B CRISPR module-associated protein Cmr5 [Candidatus Edwardsbacteria bacterium]
MTNGISLQKTLEQDRAKFAYDCAVEGNAIIKSKEYKSYSKKIPMMIKTNGLGAAFAFVKAKSNDDQHKAGYAYKLIYGHVTNWLKQEPCGMVSAQLNNGKDLAYVIVNLDSPQYRALTNEVLAFFVWLKRFAEGLIEGEANER